MARELFAAREAGAGEQQQTVILARNAVTALVRQPHVVLGEPQVRLEVVADVQGGGGSGEGIRPTEPRRAGLLGGDADRPYEVAAIQVNFLRDLAAR